MKMKMKMKVMIVKEVMACDVSPVAMFAFLFRITPSLFLLLKGCCDQFMTDQHMNHD